MYLRPIWPICTILFFYFVTLKGVVFIIGKLFWLQNLHRQNNKTSMTKNRDKIVNHYISKKTLIWYRPPLVWCGSLSHRPFFKWPRNCKQNHTCANVIRSLGQLFNRTRVRLKAHPSAITVFTPAQKIHTKGANELDFDSIKPNKTGVNSPLMTSDPAVYCKGAIWWTGRTTYLSQIIDQQLN